jgi:small subunit ribosomal protein S4
MAKNMQPILKRCRTLGIEPSVMGVDKKSNRNPGGNQRKKKSEYAIQLNEKQKAKFIYGVLEKPFRKYFEMANKKEGITGENLLSILESRLDNVIFRLGLADTRRQARQIVTHGHVLVNGKRVDIPSYLVSVGEVVSLKESTATADWMKEIVERNSSRTVPSWISADKNTLSGTIAAHAKRDDIDYEINETLIVELYSK